MSRRKGITKIIGVILLSVILAVSSLVLALADGNKLELQAEYDNEKNTVTVYYIIKDFAGTESADFRLKYDPQKLEFDSVDTHKFTTSSYMFEAGKSIDDVDVINIMFVALEKAEKDICDENGNFIAAKVVFRVKQKENVNFTSFADSYTVSPGTDIDIQSKDLNVDLTGDSITAKTDKNLNVKTDIEYEKDTNVSSSGAAENTPKVDTRQENSIKKTSKSKIIVLIVVIILLILVIVLFTFFYVKKVNKEDGDTPEPKKDKKEKTGEEDVKLDEDVIEKLDTKKSERLERHYNSENAEEFTAPTVDMDDDMSDYNSDKFDE